MIAQIIVFLLFSESHTQEIDIAMEFPSKWISMNLYRRSFFVSLRRIFSIFSVIIEYNARMYHHKPVFFPSIFKSWRISNLQNYFVQFGNMCLERSVIRSRISMFSLKWNYYIWYVWLSSILRFWPWAVHKLAANNKLLLFIKTKRAMSWTCRQI